MANVMPKRRRLINYNNVMCMCLNWYLKIRISPPLLYFRLHKRRDLHIDLIRRYEKLKIKISKKKLDIIFWKKCLNIGLCPDFLKVKPPKNKFFQCYKDLQSFIINKTRH